MTVSIVFILKFAPVPTAATPLEQTIPIGCYSNAYRLAPELFPTPAELYISLIHYSLPVPNLAASQFHCCNASKITGKEESQLVFLHRPTPQKPQKASFWCKGNCSATRFRIGCQKPPKHRSKRFSFIETCSRNIKYVPSGLLW